MRSTFWLDLFQQMIELLNLYISVWLMICEREMINARFRNESGLYMRW